MPILNESLNSSAITQATYDTDNETLTLAFMSGQSYTYEGVPLETYEGLIRTGSPGRYWHLNIKDRF